MGTFVCATCQTQGIGEKENLIDSGWRIEEGCKIACPFCSVTTVGPMPMIPTQLPYDETTKKVLVASNFYQP